MINNYIKSHSSKNYGEIPILELELERALKQTGIADGVDKTAFRRRKSIVARTARRWLRKLGYNWRDIKKGVYFDGHERLDVIAYRSEFVQYLEKLWPYIVEFEDDGLIKAKIYPEDCEIGGLERRPIIIITHDESIFQSNDGRHQGWLYQNHQFIRPKGKGQGIMVSDFLLPWSRLSTESLTVEEREHLQLPEFASILFEYGKESGHWEGKDMVNHVLKVAIPMAEAVYPGYQFLFLFDNSANHGLYAENALRAQNMNLSSGGSQSFLRDGYMGTDPTSTHVMWEYATLSVNGQQVIKTTEFGEPIKIQKGLQQVLNERGLWPIGGLRLECPKNLCSKCQSVKNCRICQKGTRCEKCRQKKVCTGPCTNRRKCDGCERRRTCTDCVSKHKCEYCMSYTVKNCFQCGEMPVKCTGNREFTIFLLQQLYYMLIILYRLLCSACYVFTT